MNDKALARSSGPRAITRVLDVLLLLSRYPDGLSLAELSASLGVAKSTFLATLRGLCERNFLVHEDSRYRLGSGAYHFASRIAASWSASDIVRAQVRALARATRESVGFAIADWELGLAIYTEAVNSEQPVRYAMQPGLRAPLYASAAGRVLLAFSPNERATTYLKRAPYRALTPRTRIDAAAIRADLAATRRQGFCASYGEMLNDTAALAVPVFDPEGDMLGAMMLAAPLDRMKANHDRSLALLVKAGHAASGRQAPPSDGR